MHLDARWPWGGSPVRGGHREVALVAAHCRLRIGVHGFSPVERFGGVHVLASATEVHIGGNRRVGTWCKAERRRWLKARVFRDNRRDSRRPMAGSLVAFGVHATAIWMSEIYEGIQGPNTRSHQAGKQQKNRQPSRVCRFYLDDGNPGGMHQPWSGPYQASAATAALKVLLGRITASSLATSGW